MKCFMSGHGYIKTNSQGCLFVLFICIYNFQLKPHLEHFARSMWLSWRSGLHKNCWFALSILITCSLNKDYFSEFLKLSTQKLPKWESSFGVMVRTQSICSSERAGFVLHFWIFHCSLNSLLFGSQFEN